LEYLSENEKTALKELIVYDEDCMRDSLWKRTEWVILKEQAFGQSQHWYKVLMT